MEALPSETRTPQDLKHPAQDQCPETGPLKPGADSTGAGLERSGSERGVTRGTLVDRSVVGDGGGAVDEVSIPATEEVHCLNFKA